LKTEKLSRNTSEPLAYLLDPPPRGFLRSLGLPQAKPGKASSGTPRETIRAYDQGRLSTPHHLFVAEGDQGIDSHGATRGDVSGGGGYQGESKRNGGDRSGVVGRNAEEQVAEQVGGGKRRR